MSIHEVLLKKYGLGPTKEVVEPISVLKPRPVEQPKQFYIPKIGTEDYERLKEESRVNLQAKVDLEGVVTGLKIRLEDSEAKRKLSETALKEQLRLKAEKLSEKQHEIESHRNRAEEAFVINARMMKDLQYKEHFELQSKEKDKLIEAMMNTQTTLEQDLKALKRHFSTATRYQEFLDYSGEPEGWSKLPKDVQDIVNVAKSFPDEFNLITMRCMIKRTSTACRNSFVSILIDDSNEDELKTFSELIGNKGKL